MTASFTASNGYTVDWREESDYYMTVTGKGKALGLSEYITSPVLRALIEFAEHRDTNLEEGCAHPVTDEEILAALNAHSPMFAEHSLDMHAEGVIEPMRRALEAARGAR